MGMQLSGSLELTGSFTTSGAIVAQTLVVQTITSSITQMTGSNIFGSSLSNIQQMTGSLSVTGSTTLTGALSGTTADFQTTIGSRYLQIRDAGSSTPSLRSVNDTIAQLRAIAIEAYTISLRTGASSGLTTTEALAISATGAATFSSSVGATGAFTSTGTTTTSLGYVTTNTTASKTHRAYTDTSGNYIIYDATLDSNRLTIASTGAATFSSSVTAGSNIVLPSGYELVYGTGTVSILGNTTTNVLDFRTSNTPRITINSSGNVGIGTSSPTGNLEIYDNSASGTLKLSRDAGQQRGQILFGRNNGGSFQNTCAIVGDSDTTSVNNGVLSFWTSNGSGTVTERMRIASDGAVYFNKAGGDVLFTKPDGTNYSIFLYSGSNSNVIFSGGSGGLGINNKANSVRIVQVSDGGNMTIQGTLTQNGSDERIKKNIQLIPNAIDKINSLRGVTFEWDKDIFPTDRTTDIGVIAQDVQSILPDAVTLAPFDTNFDDMTSKSGENYLTVYYEKLIPLLIEGIKELSAKVTALENR